MQRKTSSWLLGCGIGCGALLLLCILVGSFLYLSVRDTFKGFGAAADSGKALEEKYGAIDTYTPPADGVPSPERLEAFAAVREATQETRAAVAQKLAALPMKEKDIRELKQKSFFERLSTGLSLGRSAMTMVGEMSRFYEKRNVALLEHGMGEGEYTWLYVLTFNSWLGHSPSDGRHMGFDLDDDEHAASRKDRDEGPGLTSRVRDSIISMMRNRLASLPEGPEADAERQALEEQIEAMTSGSSRVPWQNGLPPRVTEALEPFRARLEATYDPVLNQLELARTRRRGRFSVEAD